MKKVLSIIVITAVVFTLLVGCAVSNKPGGSIEENGGKDSTDNSSATPEASSGKLFDKPVRLSFMVSSNTTYPSNPEDYVFKLVAEVTNTVIDWIIVPDPNYYNKANMAIASGDIPDIMNGNNLFAGKYGPAGAFIDVQKYLDKTPNFKKYYEMDKYQPVMRNFKAADGGMYGYPALNVEGNCRHLWFYRGDIFEKHNIKPPETYEELYEVCKKLKELYPDIYPLHFCNFILDPNDYWNEFRHLSIAWGTGFPYHFDEETKQWKLGLEEEGLKGLTMWFNKMYREKLLPQDFITMTQDQYRELLSSGKGFISMYYAEDLDRYNKTFASKNESAYFEWMKPPAGTINGQHKTFSMEFYNSLWCISQKSKLIDEAIKYTDWFYSDEAVELVSWGREGESYEIINGKKQYIIPPGREADGYRKIYGFHNDGSYRQLDVLNMKLANGEERWVKGFLAQADYEHPLPPIPVYNEEQQKVWDNLGSSLGQKISSEMAKFIMGTRDFSEWDDFIKELKDAGIDEIIRIRNEAFAATQK